MKEYERNMKKNKRIWKGVGAGEEVRKRDIRCSIHSMSKFEVLELTFRDKGGGGQEPLHM
jgi:hypothetical protein